jgi:hypothetical protein
VIVDKELAVEVATNSQEIFKTNKKSRAINPAFLLSKKNSKEITLFLLS